MRRIRAEVKRWLERLLHASGAAAVTRRLHAGDALVLGYHNVVPDGGASVGDVSLHLPVAEFRRQLDFLAQTHDVVPLQDVLRPAGRTRRPRIAITFDDAYVGAVTAAVDELVWRGMPASICVVPGMLGKAFWWDEIPFPDLETGGRDRLLSEFGGKDEAVREWARQRGLAPIAIPAHQRSADEAMLVAAIARPGITLVSHSWSHPNLAKLRSAELAEELTRPLQWLADRFGPHQYLPWLAIPYGKYSPRVLAAARQSGYSACLGLSPEWIPGGGSKLFDVPRVNVPNGLSYHGFTSRVSGLLLRR